VKNETLFGEQDGLEMNDEGVGSWTAEKYRQFQLYAHQFTQGMKGKWKSLAYLDLYAGSVKAAYQIQTRFSWDLL